MTTREEIRNGFGNIPYELTKLVFPKRQRWVYLSKPHNWAPIVYVPLYEEMEAKPRTSFPDTPPQRIVAVYELDTNWSRNRPTDYYTYKGDVER